MSARADSFANGRPWIATAADLALRWGGLAAGKRFRCRLCGHRFEAGDTVRWVFANSAGSPSRYGNFFACIKCDGPDVLQRAAAQEAEARERFWWLRED